ncbi:MAG: Excinuclease subunit domain protein [Parcubacteria group bacterium]|nr:Excinuclease subunit domain protein [Parcubacteria group bacterium]
MSKADTYYAYLLECADGTLYAGVTTDLERRVVEHNTSPKGAKYTRARRPVVMRYHESFETMSDATKREAAIKKLGRTQKLMLFEQKS